MGNLNTFIELRIVALFAIAGSLLLLSSFGYAQYTIDGNAVYVEDETFKLSVSPHTVHSPVNSYWQYFELTNKTGTDRTVYGAYGFSYPLTSGVVERWVNPVYDLVGYSTDCNNDYNYDYATNVYPEATNPHLAWCYHTICDANCWDANVWVQSFNDWNTETRTIYWDVNEVVSGNEWADETSAFTYHDATSQLGLHLYYHPSFTLQANTTLKWKIYYEPNSEDDTNKWDLLLWSGASWDCILNGTCDKNVHLDPWWGSNFLYKRLITVNSNGSVLTNYPVYVDFSSALDFSHTRTDGGDLRFTNSAETAELDYWIDYWDTTNSKGAVWVEVPSIPSSGSTTIYVYYGYASATTTSNGGNTFTFFDNFNRADSNSLGASLSTYGATTWSIDGNGLKGVGGAGESGVYWNGNTGLANYSVMMKTKSSSASNPSFGVEGRANTGVGFGSARGYMFGHRSSSLGTVWFLNKQLAWGSSASTTQGVDEWYWEECACEGNAQYGRDWSEETTRPSSWEITQGWTTMASGHFGSYMSGGANAVYWDDYIVRKFDNPDPTISIGSEQDNPSPPPTQAPSVGAVQLCDGTCAYTKTIDPASEFTVKVTATDADGDLNVSRFGVHFYTASDGDTCTEDWDCRKKDNLSSATANGCTASGDTYCITVSAGSWTGKFLAGSADVNVIAYDDGGRADSNEHAGSINVNSYAGVSADASTAIYSGNPNSTQNTILTDQTNAYIVITHNGNCNLTATVTCATFTKNGDSISVENQKFNPDADVYGSATACDGTAQNMKTGWGRGTDPTSATNSTYFWLNIPSEQPVGDYTSSLTIGATVS